MTTYHGYAAKLYVGTAGSTAGTEVSIVRDATVSMEAAEADDTTRGGGGWGSTSVTIRKATVEFEIRYDPAAAGFATIRNAYDAGSAIALCPRDSAGGSGIDADFVISNFSNPQPLEGILVVNVTAKLSTALRTLTRV